MLQLDGSERSLLNFDNEPRAQRPSGLLPLRDIRQEHARSDHLFETSFKLPEGFPDDPQSLTGLTINVPQCHDLAVRTSRRRPADSTMLPARTARE